MRKRVKKLALEDLVEQLRENPYYQYFIGMPGYEFTNSRGLCLNLTSEFQAKGSADPSSRKPIRKPNARIIQTVLKLSAGSVLQSENSVLVCCTQS